MKQKFVECYSNILETLLCDYWNFPKGQHLFSSNHTFLTQTQLFLREFLEGIFSLKIFPGSPEHSNVEGTLNEYSQNIACRRGSGLKAEETVGTFYEKGNN